MNEALTEPAPAPRPKQLRPFTFIITLIEVGLALWALSNIVRYWQIADGPLPPQFWGALAGFGFTAGLVATNLVGILQTVKRLGGRPPLGQRLPFRLPAANEANPEIVWGLLPLALAFGTPVYPLIRLAFLDWGEIGFMWGGMALVSFLAAMIMGYIILRQFYLMLNGGQTVVEASHETLQPGQTVQFAIAHRSGRFKTQELHARLVCRLTVRRDHYNPKKGTGQRYVTTLLHEETLKVYHEREIPFLQMAGQPITVTIPADAQASTEPDHYPHIEWRVEVDVKVADAPDFQLIFLCTVEEIEE
jgi:hypothetical protein